ncbi:MAG: hypothetical protein ABWK01_01605 [Infirmifilum sp.]
MLLKPGFPPSPSLVTSWFWEGYLAAKEEGFDISGDDRAGRLNTIFTGNDFGGLKRLCPSLSEKKGEEGQGVFEGFYGCLQGLVEDREDVVESKLMLKEKIHAYGLRDFLAQDLAGIKEKGLSLQVMKVDRYQGVSSLELGTLSSQLTVYADPYATLLFLRGVVSTFSFRLGADEHYFLFFSPTEYPTVERSTSMLLSARNTLRDELQNAVRELQGWMEEYVYLRLIFNREVVKKLRENLGVANVTDLKLRVVRLNKEGRTHKVYMDMPLEIHLASKIYEDEQMLNGIQESLKSLAGCASKFVQRRDKSSKFVQQRDKFGDGYHAYMAIKRLYMYVQTGNPAFLVEYNREVATIRDIASANNAPGICAGRSPRLIEL